MTNTQLNRNIATLGIRVIIAIIFVLWGYQKVINWGVVNVYQMAFKPYESTWIPIWLLKFTCYYTSYVEFIGGLLLLIGLFRDYVIYALVSILVIITFGHLTLSLEWDMQHMFVRGVFLFTLLMLPKEWDKFCADNIFYYKIKS